MWHRKAPFVSIELFEMARPRRVPLGPSSRQPDLFEELAQTSTSVLGASVIAQRARRPGWRQARMDDQGPRYRPRNKAMIQERRHAIEGFALPNFSFAPAIFWCLETIAAGIRPEALVECFRRQAL